MMNKQKEIMKKIIVAVTAVLMVNTVFAQDLTSKKGEPILPEAGDWGLSINANPFFSYAKSLFGSNKDSSAPSFDYLSKNYFFIGKYFVTEKLAYRGGLRLGFGSHTQNAIVQKDQSTNSQKPVVTDTRKERSTGVGVSLGIEYRKGKTRLQGFYGADAGFFMGGGVSRYTYGNPYSATNLSATYWDFDKKKQVNAASRITEEKSGMIFMLGIRGFVGAEYFIFPKISLGGEFGWGLSVARRGEGHVIVEGWDNSLVPAQVNQVAVQTGSETQWGFDGDNNNSLFGPAGTLRLNLHF